MSTAPPAAKRHFATLDGLRGVAAITVVGRHSLEAFDLTYLVPHAQLAVDFFFLLSGFVVAYAYEQRLLTGMSVQDFIKIRLIRLYPLIAVGLLFGFAVYGLKLHIETHAWPQMNAIMAFVCGIFLLPSHLIHDEGWSNIYPFNDPSWSLFFEILVNVLYALILPKLTMRVLKFIVAAGCALVFVQAYSLGAVNVGYHWHDILYGVGRVVFPFFCGVLLFRGRGLWERFNCPLPALVPAAILVGILLFPVNQLNWLYESGAVVVAFPALVIFGAQIAPSPRISAICLYLGRLSYPLYILHYPFIRLCSHLARVLAVAGSQLWIIVGAEMMCAITFAVIVMSFFDEPVRAWLTRQRRLAPQETQAG